MKRFKRGDRVMRLCVDKAGRFVSSHVWTVASVSRARNLIVIADRHGASHWTYDLDGVQREANASFRSELVLLRD